MPMLKFDMVSNWIEAIPFDMHRNVVGSISIDGSIQFDGEIQMEPLGRSKSIRFSIYYRLFAFSANKTKIHACVSGCRRIFSSHTIVIHFIKIYRWKEKTQNPNTHTNSSEWEEFRYKSLNWVYWEKEKMSSDSYQKMNYRCYTSKVVQILTH